MTGDGGERPGGRALRVLHTSDIHVGLTYGFPEMEGLPAEELPARVIAALPGAVAQHGVDIVVIAGDLFDSNRVAAAAVMGVFDALEAARAPAFLLPGNHDPLTADSPYARFARPANVHVFGEAGGQLLEDPRAPVQLWGQAHLSYDDFRPCDPIPEWSALPGDAWRIVVAHGHFEAAAGRGGHSWPLAEPELRRAAAHYVALGHWDTHEPVGAGQPPAWYCGSPCRTGMFAVADLSEEGVDVRQVPWLS